jgi:hypothetical protein
LTNEAVDAADALAFYTKNAFASFEEDKKGTVSAGKLADLIALSEDPLSSQSEIQNIK